MTGKLKKYFLWEKQSLQAAKDLINERNRTLLFVLQSSMIFFYLVLLIFSLIQNGYSSFQMLYAFFLVYMILCLFLIIKSPLMPINVPMYGIYIVTILLCMYASAFVDPIYINSEAYIFFLLFPVLYLDYSIRIDTVNLILSALYLYNILDYKVGKALVLEATNIICFALLGIIVGHFVRWRTLKSFVMVKSGIQLELREPLTGLPNHRSLIKDLASLPMNPQAVVFVRISELRSPVLSLGLDFQETQIGLVCDALKKAAEEQGIQLYCCGSEIVGIVQPRLLEGVFQRLEPLHHVLSSFEFHTNKNETIHFHFGIGAALYDGNINDALNSASDACTLAQKDGMNRIVINS